MMNSFQFTREVRLGLTHQNNAENVAGALELGSIRNCVRSSDQTSNVLCVVLRGLRVLWLLLFAR